VTNTVNSIIFKLITSLEADWVDLPIDVELSKGSYELASAAVFGGGTGVSPMAVSGPWLSLGATVSAGIMNPITSAYSIATAFNNGAGGASSDNAWTPNFTIQGFAYGLNLADTGFNLIGGGVSASIGTGIAIPLSGFNPK
jgi:hypothetical protein